MKKIYFLLFAFCLFTSVNAQIINIPDGYFKAKLLEANSTNTIAKNLSGNYFKIDVNDDGEIDNAEALEVSYLNVSNSFVSSVTGLTSFTNLQYFYCVGNYISVLDVSTLTSLIDLSCAGNELTSLNLNGLSNLKNLDCMINQLTQLDASVSPNLETLSCGRNSLTTLNISNLPLLRILNCSLNQLTSLNFSGIISLYDLSCYSNLLTTLDVSNLRNLDYLTCYNNPLVSMFIKNGKNESLTLYSCPNLRYICADESEILNVQNILTTYGYSNCHVNSYCSFVPGGRFYTIQGNNRFDSSGDGCGVTDPLFSDIRFNISSGAITGNIIPNSTGNYSIPVQAGTHTITPLLENPTYFNVSPSSVNVTFPGMSPFFRNFCVTANGIHSDLEITLLPIEAARPGFDADYKLIYKNKGTTVQSGIVNLTFNDDVLDFVSANPAISNQTLNSLSWDFVDLQPFETREITLTLNVNSPIETPAVNDGDVLNYTTTMTSPATDETPSDNTFTFNQTVVNSFDPNDKTCLEGTTIAPSEVGKYVHYMIRFENTGTFPAQNIVVKDMIDTNKFDVNSLVPIKGSHDYFTRIDGNKVEFIFENINLPFDDANNDGYLAFKIKTKPTLVVGNTFSNSVSIYFDYNFPIVTNTAVTTIQALSNQDFSFGSYFMLYPNPVNDVLNIETKQTIEVSSISIYNQLGQLVLIVPSAQNVSKMDVSSLASGNYFIKINSDKGTSNTKFIKL